MPELLRRLRIELTRSPKKTAILAVGLVVAAVFWGRALWKTSDDEPVAAQSASASTVGVVGLPPSSAASQVPSGHGPGAAGSVAKGGEPSWDDLLVWMRSAIDGDAAETPDPVGRDPFEADDPTLAIVSLEEEPEPGEDEVEPDVETTEEPIAPPVDPERAAAEGLTVQGILKVGSRRFAQLANRSLTVGEEFEIPDFRTDQGAPSLWVVAEIDAGGVVIRPSAGGEPLRLSLNKPELTGVRVERLGK